VNGPISLDDSPALILKKLAKSVLATKPVTGLIEKLIALAERARVPEHFLWRGYTCVIGLYIFHGWREGLETLRRRGEIAHAQSLGYHSNL
jgi:hypothetical protein